MPNPTVAPVAQSEPARVADKGASVHGRTADFAIDTTQQMVHQGHLVSAAEFQTRMGWSSRHTVVRALKDRRVFALSLDSKKFFPAFFADAAYDRRHLAAVTKGLGDLQGGAKLQFFITRKGSLGGKTALEALAAGQLERVLRSAAAFAER